MATLIRYASVRRTFRYRVVPTPRNSSQVLPEYFYIGELGKGRERYCRAMQSKVFTYATMTDPRLIMATRSLEPQPRSWGIVKLACIRHVQNKKTGEKKINKPLLYLARNTIY